MAMRLLHSVGLACLGLALWLGLCPVAAAQTLTPPPGATYGQPLPVPPMRPLYYHPFTNYDLLYGYSRGALTAPQPIGHEHIPLGRNGYIYQPVYSTPAPPPAMPAQPAVAGPARGPQTAAAARSQAGQAFLRRLSDAPPPAPESVIRQQTAQPQPAQPKQAQPQQAQPQPTKPAKPAVRREF